MLSSMEVIDSNSIELYNRYAEILSEVDKRPKNVQLLTKKGQTFMPMYERGLLLKEQLEALTAWLYEQEVLREEYKNREVV